MGAKPGQVPQETLNRLAIYEVPILVGLYICALVCVLLYPITRQRHADNLQAIARSAT